MSKDANPDTKPSLQAEKISKASPRQVLKELTLSGFKSIGEMQNIQFGDINLFIGANGAGKSNLVSFFRLLGALADGSLQTFIAKQGYADGILHYGLKQLYRITAELLFEDKYGNRNRYEFALSHSFGGQMLFDQEIHDIYAYDLDTHEKLSPQFLNSGKSESRLPFFDAHPSSIHYKMLQLLRGIKVYQLHDTSADSAIRQPAMLQDNRQLHSDGSNLPAFLYQMKVKEDSREYYERIIKRISNIMPQFRDFDLQPAAENRNMIRLDWRDKNREHIFGVHQISDGSLRFMALASLLLQPPNTMPGIIVIDEPELGLHPDALMDLAGVVKIASAHSQIILCTQSSFLLNLFEADDIIVVSAKNGQTEFNRLSPEELKAWIEDYSLAELWEKNLIGGRP